MAFFAPCRAEFACFRPWTGIGRPHEPTFLCLFFSYGASMHVGTLSSKYRHAWAWNNRATGVWFPLPASPLGAAEGTKNLHYDSHRWYKLPSSLLFFCLGDPYRHFEVTLVEWQGFGSNWASRYYVNSVIGGFGFACFRAENRQRGNFRSFKSNSFRLSFSSDLVMDI